MRGRLNSWAIVAGLFLCALGSAIIHPIAASDPRQDSYPPPVTETIEPVGQATPTLLFPTALPYPAAGTDLGAATPLPIGVESGVGTGQSALGGEAADVQPPAPAPSERGLLILWVGFTATLLIFLTSVVGSIVLFTRRNES